MTNGGPTPGQQGWQQGQEGWNQQGQPQPGWPYSGQPGQQGWPGWPNPGQQGGPPPSQQGVPTPTQQAGPIPPQHGGPYPPSHQPQPPAAQFTAPRHQPPGELPLTLPGWGAVPAVLGAVLAIVGLFALKWVGEANFSDLNEAINKSGELTGGNEKWLKLYLRQGVIIAVALSALAPVMWSLGSLRNRESVKRRGGLMKKSLSEGNTGPTRIFISALAGLSLVYHVVSLLILTDGGTHLDELGPGPWVLVTGTALSVAGALIGPRLPRR